MNELATLDAPPELRESVAACVRWSEANVIEGAATFQCTADHLKQIKTRQKQADEFFDPPIKQAHELHKMLVARKKVITEPLAQSERIDKQKMLTYQQEEQRKQEAERRRLQAIADERARKERERVEQEAARQRQVEEEQRAKAEEARRQAEAACEADRKRLLAEAEAADRKANAAAVKVEMKADQAAAVVAPVVAVSMPAAKVAGVATKKVWKARVVDKAAVPDDFKIVDEAKLNAYARAMKEGAKVPGVEFYAEESLSARGS